MSVKLILPNIDSNDSAKKTPNKITPKAIYYSAPSKSAQKNSASNISFQGGFNPMVSLMDFIAMGGFAASFIIQDGIGFIAPRMRKGLLRGGKKKKDENGNDILDKNGNPKRELNWAYARKEGLREVITGPSAFLIPLGLLKVVKKNFGAANNVKLNYLDGFENSFTKFAKDNVDLIETGTANARKVKFYEDVLSDVIKNSINEYLPKSEQMSAAEIQNTARAFALKQLQIEDIKSDKSLSKSVRKSMLKELGSVESDFMALKKLKIGGAIDELTVNIKGTDGSLKGGAIGELLEAMNDYFSDGVHSMKKSLKNNLSAEQIENTVKQFTKHKMGSRVLTNLGIFGAVAAFYTQIPKLYNMGLKGNPALAADEEASTTQNPEQKQEAVKKGSNPSFTGVGSILEKAGDKVFHGRISKKISDIFELNGPVIAGTAMSTLLYGFCIPPRLSHAQDKYDYGEIMVRDVTSFTALLFGAKALARLFSDGFTKMTGLALNKKNLEGRNTLQKIGDYLSPNDTRHSVLSSGQLNSKYTNIDLYRGKINGFVDFIESSGGNIKKAFAHDKNILEVVENIVKDFNGKSYKQATVDEIKQALKSADKNNSKLINDLYTLFKNPNGLLNRAKTCNSTFGFLSTLVFVPGLIIWLGNFCERLTNNRQKKDKQDNLETVNNIDNKMKVIQRMQQGPTMAGFLGKTAN